MPPQSPPRYATRAWNARRWAEVGGPPLICLLHLQEPEKRIVQELLETEQAYVARLHLLDQVGGQDAPGPGPRVQQCSHKLIVPNILLTSVN